MQTERVDKFILFAYNLFKNIFTHVYMTGCGCNGKMLQSYTVLLHSCHFTLITVTSVCHTCKCMLCLCKWLCSLGKHLTQLGVNYLAVSCVQFAHSRKSLCTLPSPATWSLCWSVSPPEVNTSLRIAHASLQYIFMAGCLNSQSVQTADDTASSEGRKQPRRLLSGMLPSW